MKRLAVILVLAALPSCLLAARPMHAYMGMLHGGRTGLSSEVCLLPSYASVNGGARAEAALDGTDKVFYPLFLRVRTGFLFLDAGVGFTVDGRTFQAFGTVGGTIWFGVLSLTARVGALYRGSFVPLVEFGMGVF
mgnify:CR=1 FL=1